MGETKSLSGRQLLWCGAALCAVSALPLSKEALVSAFGEESLADGASALAIRGRWILFGLGVVLFGVGWKVPGVGRRAALVMLSTLLPVLGFEAYAGPFVGRDTTIFQRDEELGWRLRPGAKDLWLGAEVEINERGMRGPLPREGADQTILFLGDSVVFGAFIERVPETLSSRTEASLASEGRKAQCLNAGVGGWSPWQERAWFEAEGAQLGADVVLVHLVLNDVTEPLVLERHGGSEEGFQLDRARDPGWVKGTSWGTAVRRWRRMARASEREAASRAEALGVYEFLRSPALPATRDAWRVHMEEVEALVASIQAAGARPVVISHPYTVQFEVPGLWWPQDAVAAWCASRGVPHLDAGRVIATDYLDPLRAYHDAVHPNSDGAAFLGRAIAAFLLDEGLVL